MTALCSHISAEFYLKHLDLIRYSLACNLTEKYFGATKGEKKKKSSHKELEYS